LNGGVAVLKSCLAITLFGFCVCYSEVAMSATPATTSRPNDQPGGLAQDSVGPRHKHQKNPETELPQKSPAKARDLLPPVMSETLGPFSPLHIDP
jgi:Spy/CpxP family protein refolding chaperone